MASSKGSRAQKVASTRGRATRLRALAPGNVHPDLAYARQVVATEARAVQNVAERLDESFARAVASICACNGRVVVTGMGKAGFLAQRLSAICASVGIPSLYLHPADAVHGDLGRVTQGDVVIALSNSGATEEILRLLPTLKTVGVTLIVLTGRRHSPLARAAAAVVDNGPIDQACPLGLVPTASSAALHALGDALAMTVTRNRNVSTEEYARYHPGGSLGRTMVRVREVMRDGAANPLVQKAATLSEAIVVMTNTRGRPGCAVVVDRQGRLAGIFTDGDLRRLLENGTLDLHAAVGTVMNARPKTVAPTDLVVDAAEVLRARAIDQVAVVDSKRRPVGLLDVQDLLAARFIE
jgi:arabinose-5-phosphate isomerase